MQTDVSLRERKGEGAKGSGSQLLVELGKENAGHVGPQAQGELSLRLASQRKLRLNPGLPVWAQRLSAYAD